MYSGRQERHNIIIKITVAVWNLTMENSHQIHQVWAKCSVMGENYCYPVAFYFMAKRELWGGLDGMIGIEIGLKWEWIQLQNWPTLILYWHTWSWTKNAWWYSKILNFASEDRKPSGLVAVLFNVLIHLHCFIDCDIYDVGVYSFGPKSTLEI